MKRIQWLDDLKGLAIVLIVAGHVVATLGNMTTGDAQAVLGRIFDFIYSFHVPLFFSIAGLTFNIYKNDNSAVHLHIPPSPIPFGSFLKKKFMRLMVPYYIWGLASAAAYVLMGQCVAADIQSVATTTSFADKTLHGEWWVPFVSILHAGTWPDGKGFCFNGVLWFLPVMFSGEIIYYWIARLFRTREQIFFVFTLLLAMMLWLYPYLWGIPFPHFAKCGNGVLRYLPFGITNLIQYLPFIALGHCFATWFLRHAESQLTTRSDSNSPTNSHISRNVGMHKTYSLIAGIFLLVYFFLSYFLPIARKNSALPVRWFVLTLPMIGALMAMAKFKWLRTFGFLAPFTLGIMLFHKFPLVLGQIALGRSHFLQSPFYLRAPSMIALSLALLFTIALTLLCCIISKVIIRFVPWSLGTNSHISRNVGIER